MGDHGFPHVLRRVCQFRHFGAQPRVTGSEKLKAEAAALILARGSEQRPGPHARGLLGNPG
jgi:hypothetical protein